MGVPGASPYWAPFAPFPISSDLAAYQRVKQDVALYRLTLGQQRQDDMIELLRRRGVQADGDEMERLRTTLTP